MATYKAARAGITAELPALLRLAGPVIAAELGWMTMWLVDTIMVGRVSAEAIGAVSIGGSLFFTVAIFGMGMLLGLDFVVAHAFGAGRLADAHHALVDAVYLSVALAVLLTGIVVAGTPGLALIGMEEAVLRQATPYLQAMTWSLLPLLLFASLRRYLQALGLVVPIMVTLVSANVVNALACWVFVFGHLGAPALGAEGAGWATCISRAYMFLALLVYTLARERRHATGLFLVDLRPDLTRLRELVRLGAPAACQMALEIGVFACATALAARVATNAVAAHQVAINAAALTFMVPFGLSSAGAVRVGQALGRGDLAAARRTGWTALAVSAVFMLAAGVTFVLVPRPILRVFTADAAVIEIGVSLLYVAAAFQLFDGAQVTATGILRGTGETRIPMLANLVGHWAIGLPIGWVLCVRYGLGVVGLWIGLTAGLIAVALALLVAWARRVRALERSFGSHGLPPDQVPLAAGMT